MAGQGISNANFQTPRIRPYHAVRTAEVIQHGSVLIRGMVQTYFFPQTENKCEGALWESGPLAHPLLTALTNQIPLPRPRTLAAHCQLPALIERTAPL